MQPGLPDWIAPVTPADTLNGQDSLATVISSHLAGNKPIPVAYGNVQIGGQIFAANYTGGYWYIGAYFCVGEIEAIDAIYLNGAAPVGGISYNTYTGTTSQGVDALLAEGISGYSDALVVTHPAGNIGIAYATFKYQDTDYSGFPSIVAEARGRKVYNPATTLTAYSDTPALALRDFIANQQFGMGAAVDDTSLQTLQTDNDATATTEPRRRIGLVISGSKPATDWVNILQTYAGGWAYRRGDTWFFASDRPGTSVATFTDASPSNIVKDSLSVKVADLSRVPTRVRAIYTDTQPTIWTERRKPVAELAGVSAGTTPLRESVISLPGVTRYSQAVRETEERLNKLQQAVTISFVAFDDYLGIEVGDIITLNHAYGFTNALFRVTRQPVRVSPGRVRIEAVSYSVSDYSNVEPATPSYNANDNRLGDEVGAEDVLNDFTEWTQIQDTAGLRPANNATANAPSLGVKVGYGTFTVLAADYPAFYLHGYDEDGVAADVAGYTLVNGQRVAIPARNVFTVAENSAAYNAQTEFYIVYDTANTTPFTSGESASDWALAWKESDGTWYFQDALAPQSFTPTDDIVAIGMAWITPDTPVVGEALADGATLWGYGQPITRLGDFTGTNGAIVGLNLQNAIALGNRNLVPRELMTSGYVSAQTNVLTRYVLLKELGENFVDSAFGLEIGEVISATLWMSADGGDWRFGIRARNSTVVVGSAKYSATCNNGEEGYFGIDGFQIPSGADRIELFVDPLGVGDVDYSNMQIVRGEVATAYSEPYEIGADKAKPYAAGRFVHNFSTDANYTLETAARQEEWIYKFMEFTDTGTLLTAGRDVVFPSENGPEYIITNSTAQTLTFKISGQTGATLAAGATGRFYYDGMDIVAAP